MDNNFISACVATYNSGDKAVNICKQLIKYTKKYPLKLYVVDNASSDDTAERIEKIGNVTVIKNSTNVGFGAAHNAVIKQEMGKYHFVINPDIEIKNDILSQIVDFMEQNQDILMLMPKILNPDNTEQYLPKKRPTFKRLYLGRLARLGGYFKRIRDEFTLFNTPIDTVTDIEFCSGCFFCIKGELFKKLNGFDERYFMYLEDADLSLKVKQHGRVVIAPQFSVVHLWERDSAKKLKYLLIHISSSLKFLNKWRGSTL